jgi:hypothetical protein
MSFQHMIFKSLFYMQLYLLKKCISLGIIMKNNKYYSSGLKNVIFRALNNLLEKAELKSA